jgi:hypothetical protein
MPASTRRRAWSVALIASLVCLAAPAAAAGRECTPRASMDERAQCVLGTPAGRRALAAIGEAAPADLEVRQAHAALTPSFNRYVIRHAGVEKARPALETATADAYLRHTGRTLAQWRADWVASLGAARTPD